MSKKTKTGGKKRIIRHEAGEAGGGGGEAKPAAPESDEPRIAPRIKEKDGGFAVLKGVAIGIMALIVVSMVLFNRAGGQDTVRGDKLPGEQCENTVDCKKGTICYSYQGERRRCMTVCEKDRRCDPGYKCVSAADQRRRKGIRVTDICVPDDGKK